MPKTGQPDLLLNEAGPGRLPRFPQGSRRELESSSSSQPQMLVEGRVDNRTCRPIVLVARGWRGLVVLELLA